MRDYGVGLWRVRNTHLGFGLLCFLLRVVRIRAKEFGIRVNGLLFQGLSRRV